MRVTLNEKKQLVQKESVMEKIEEQINHDIESRLIDEKEIFGKMDVTWNNSPIKEDAVKITALYGDTAGVGMYRLFNPMLKLRKDGLINPITRNYWEPDQLMFGDVCLMNRTYNPNFIPHIKEVANYRHVNYEIDDQLFNIDPSNPAFEAYCKDMNHKKAIIEFLKISHSITTTTIELANELSKYNSNIRIVPNSIDFELRNWIPKDYTKENKFVKIYYGFSTSHYKDFELIVPAIKEICQKYKYKKIKFVFQSHPSLIEHMIEKHDLPVEKIEIMEFVDIKEYPEVFNTIDIALAPIVHSNFNACKSNLKIIEAGACCIPSVAENFQNYTKTQLEGMDVLLANGTKEWVDQISRLIDSADLRKSVGLNAYKHVRQYYDLNNNYIKHLDAWQGIGNTYEKVNYTDGRNELCPCGSGKKIKKCHENSWIKI